MKQNTEIMHLYLEPNKNVEGPGDSPFNYFLVSDRHRWYCSDDTQIRIEEVEVSYFVPEKMDEQDLTLAAIKQLKERQDKVRADAEKRVNEIEGHIQKLLMLTHQS